LIICKKYICTWVASSSSASSSNKQASIIDTLTTKLNSLNSQLNRCPDDQSGLQWQPYLSSDGTTNIGPTNFTNGFNSSTNWVFACSLYDSWAGNLRMRVTMGLVVDYFRPIDVNSTLCSTLLSTSLHEWSISPTKWWSM
jgi:hypothetical protein